MPGHCSSQAAHLDGDSGDDGLGVDERGVAQVVEAVRGEDLSAGLEPHRLLELHTSILLLRGSTTASYQSTLLDLASKGRPLLDDDSRHNQPTVHEPMSTSQRQAKSAASVCAVQADEQSMGLRRCASHNDS